MKSSSKPDRPFSSPTTNNGHMVVLYNECLKNHAVSLGGHALDGCGEFIMLTDPPSLRCDACGCHRNFHRRDSPDVSSHHRSQSPPSLQPVSSTPHLLLTLSSSGFSGPSDQEKRKFTGERDVMLKKRTRTKFTAEQKVKMRGFAERARWKINGCDDKCVREFCSEVGIERGVLKVRFHNNRKNRNTTSSTSQKL